MGLGKVASQRDLILYHKKQTCFRVLRLHSKLDLYNGKICHAKYTLNKNILLFESRWYGTNYSVYFAEPCCLLSGAVVDPIDQDGETPLMLAAQFQCHATFIG